MNCIKRFATSHQNYHHFHNHSLFSIIIIIIIIISHQLRYYELNMKIKINHLT